MTLYMIFDRFKQHIATDACYLVPLSSARTISTSATAKEEKATSYRCQAMARARARCLTRDGGLFPGDGLRQQGGQGRGRAAAPAQSDDGSGHTLPVPC